MAGDRDCVGEVEQVNEKDKLAWERACDALYGFGYSEQFSMALWQAALEYARQPAQAVAVDNCMRSHPHENMSLTCQLKTEIERLKKERNVYKEECEKAVAKYNRLFFKNISNVFLSFLTPAAGSPHPDDEAVDKFASAMKQKLAQAREKGRSGWQQMTPDELSAMLYHHVEKGDPRDVANFCMFLWNLGQPITQCHKTPAVAVNEQLLEALRDFSNYVRTEQSSTDGHVQYSNTQINRLVFKVRHAIAAAEAAKGGV